MSFKKKLIYSAILLSSFSAHAQFGGFLNKIAKEAEKKLQQNDREADSKAITDNTPKQAEKAETPQPSKENTPQTNKTGESEQPKMTSDGKMKTMPAEAFCKKLEESTELKEFASLAKALATNHNSRYFFETEDRLISRWLTGKLAPMLNHKNKNYDNYQSYIYSSEQAANECALSIRNTDLLYLMSIDQKEYEVLKSSLDKIAAERQPRTFRKIDASGNIVNAVAQAPKKSFSAIGDYDRRSVGRGLSTGFPPQWLVTWLILLDENGQILKNTYPIIREQTVARLEILNSEKKANADRREKEKKEEADRLAKEGAAQQAEINKYRTFANSPEGKLTIAYQHYQIVQTCNEVRKGYAAQFINDAELDASTRKIKAIESAIKPALSDKNTDKIWAAAIARNKKWNPMEGSGYNVDVNFDVIDTIKANNKNNWTAAQKDCAHFFDRFNAFSDEIIGKEGPKKSF